MKYAPLHILILLAVIVLFANCKKDDDYVYPSVITEFMLAESDETGTVSYISSDDGQTYKVLNRNKFTNLNPNWLYRVYCVYELSQDTDDAAYVYSLQSILSPNPVQASIIVGGVKTDPLNVQSVWRSGYFINLSLLVKSQVIQKHTFHFIDDGISTVDNHKEINLTLYHNQGGDEEDYFQLVYLSVPLKMYENKLSEGDSILLKINTFKGFVTYNLNY